MICELRGQSSDNGGPPQRVRVTCVRCGTFEWEPSTFAWATPEANKSQVKLSAFVREQNVAGIFPFLTANLLREVEQQPLPRLRDRALRALTAIIEEVGYSLTGIFDISDKASNPIRILL